MAGPSLPMNLPVFQVSCEGECPGHLAEDGLDTVLPSASALVVVEAATPEQALPPGPYTQGRQAAALLDVWK